VLASDLGAIVRMGWLWIPRLFPYWQNRPSKNFWAVAIDDHCAFPVQYQKERTATLHDAAPQPPEFALLLTKFDSWRYEREYRLFAGLDHCERQGDLYFYPLKGEALKLREVILGLNCTLPLEKIREIVNIHYPDVVTIKARMADSYFRIEPDEETVPLYQGPAFPGQL
jgi:hypothetical protein